VGSFMACEAAERLAHPRRGGKPEFKLRPYPPLHVPACVCPTWAQSKWGSSPLYENQKS
jgi:hypothetical protein